MSIENYPSKIYFSAFFLTRYISNIVINIALKSVGNGKPGIELNGFQESQTIPKEFQFLQDRDRDLLPRNFVYNHKYRENFHLPIEILQNPLGLPPGQVPELISR